MQRLQYARCGPRLRRAFAADAVDRVAVRSGDEPFLEGETAVGRVEPRAQLLVGCGKDGGLHAERSGEFRGHRREWRAFLQRLRAHDVQAEIAVAEAKPRLGRE